MDKSLEDIIITEEISMSEEAIATITTHSHKSGKTTKSHQNGKAIKNLKNGKIMKRKKILIASMLKVCIYFWPNLFVSRVNVS